MFAFYLLYTALNGNTTLVEWWTTITLEQKIERGAMLPNYVLRTNEAILNPHSQPKGEKNFRWAVLTAIALLMLYSFITGNNLFSALPWFGWVGLGLVVIRAIFRPKPSNNSSRMEIRFFDDGIVLYQTRRNPAKQITRKQLTAFMYDNIAQVTHKKENKLIQILGAGTSVWYDSDSQGNLPETPTKKQSFSKALVQFSTTLAPELDFVQEIEDHSPLKVVIEE